MKLGNNRAESTFLALFFMEEGFVIWKKLNVKISEKHFGSVLPA